MPAGGSGGSSASPGAVPGVGVVAGSVSQPSSPAGPIRSSWSGRSCSGNRGSSSSAPTPKICGSRSRSSSSSGSGSGRPSLRRAGSMSRRSGSATSASPSSGSRSCRSSGQGLPVLLPRAPRALPGVPAWATPQLPLHPQQTGPAVGPRSQSHRAPDGFFPLQSHWNARQVPCPGGAQGPEPSQGSPLLGPARLPTDLGLHFHVLSVFLICFSN